MTQPSIMFVAGEIKQKLLHEFSEVIFDPPFSMISYSAMLAVLGTLSPNDPLSAKNTII